VATGIDNLGTMRQAQPARSLAELAGNLRSKQAAAVPPGRPTLVHHARP